MKTLFLTFALLFSFSPKYHPTKDGIIYWVDNEEKDAIISVFGMRDYSEEEVGQFLLKKYEEKDTITRKMVIETSKAKIYGCYTYEDNVNQYLITFCAEKYLWNDGDSTFIPKSDWCLCE
jgi:hypothetical protein